MDYNYDTASVEIANSEFAVNIGGDELYNGASFNKLGASGNNYECIVYSHKKVNIEDITQENENGLLLNLALSGLTKDGVAVGNGDPITLNKGELRIRTVPLTYKVTYDINAAQGGNGTPPVDSNTYKYGDTAVVLEPGGKMANIDNKGFAGWNTSPDGKGETFMPGSNLLVEDNITLYAIWSDEKFAVQKVWDDYNNALGIRPDEVGVQLQKGVGSPDDDGSFGTYENVGNPVPLNFDNGWRASFSVPQGEDISNYRVVELSSTGDFTYTKGYFAEISRPYTFQITNTLRDATIKIKKIDKDTRIAIENAEFRLLRTTPASGGKLTDVYLDRTTTSKGQAVFEGLAVGEYELIEMKAPTGYQRVKKGWTIKISDPNTKWEGTTPLAIEVIDSNGQNLIANSDGYYEIENQNVTELPPVGGMGKHIFAIFAAGLTLIALYLRILFCRRVRGGRRRRQ